MPTEFNLKRDKSLATVNKKPSLTQPQFAGEVNINQIMERAARTGQIGDPFHQTVQEVIVGDFSSGIDFHEAQNRIVEAQQAFDELPAHVRKRFNNNPAELIDFCMSDKNKEEAIELGLIPKPEEKPVGEPVKKAAPEAAAPSAT